MPTQTGGPEGDGPRGAEDASGHLVEPPVEIDRSIAQKGGDDLQGLLEAPDALIEWEAEHPVFRLPVSRAEAEDEATARYLVQRVGHFGEKGRVTEEGRDDERPEGDRGGDAGERAEEGERLPAAEFVRFAGAVNQVIGEPERIETDRLGGQRQRFDVAEAAGLIVPRDLRRPHDRADSHGSRALALPHHGSRVRRLRDEP